MGGEPIEDALIHGWDMHNGLFPLLSYTAEDTDALALAGARDSALHMHARASHPDAFSFHFSQRSVCAFFVVCDVAGSTSLWRWCRVVMLSTGGC